MVIINYEPGDIVSKVLLGVIEKDDKTYAVYELEIAVRDEDGVEVAVNKLTTHELLVVTYNNDINVWSSLKMVKHTQRVAVELLRTHGFVREIKRS